ncbi:probable serine/threonine-protein kinase PIX13 [Impatiens glandulifera]|uniref:probable serine/threonine-protein kinase PIX13 n=1 Tax=Impatiens glandulifera TaxID=253017 RepID=UPI001FB074C0|nr:probable serine/threonine-protein kinase PIX13 [Impatiens glandulifera]
MGNCLSGSDLSIDSNPSLFKRPSNSFSDQERSENSCRVSDGLKDAPIRSRLKVYSYAELRTATRNFKPDTILGKGGFGTVYKGYYWMDHQEKTDQSGSSRMIIIAIKKLNHDQTMQGLREWKCEVEFLGRLSHPNLVKLLGYCCQGNELLLVYEFMQRGSLENHLFRRNSVIVPLPWEIRVKIAIGAARGLAFLHSSNNQIIYRDFKASNILLDGDYNAKISDFGLAKFGPNEGDSHVTTRIMGTSGYAAPEYISTGHLYVKSDVYGFGVVLLEILTGLRVFDMERARGQQNLVDWARPYLKRRNKLRLILEDGLEVQCGMEVAFMAAKLVLQCLECEPQKRPSMEQVVLALEQLETFKEKRPKNVRIW